MPSYSRTALDIPDEISRSGKNLHRWGSDQSESLVVISRCAQAAARLVPPREIHGVRPDRGDGGRARDEAAQQDTGRAGLFREPRMVIKWVGAPLNLPADLKPQRCRLHAVP